MSAAPRPTSWAVDDIGREGIVRPARGIAARHDVGVAGEAEIATGVAESGIEIEDVRRPLLGEDEAMAGKAQPFERRGEDVDRALIVRRHARPPDEVAREAQRIDRAAAIRQRDG